MVGPLFHGARQGENFVGCHIGRCNRLDHLGFTHRQCPRFVENDHVELGRLFQCASILEQDPVHGAQPRADHNRHWRGEPQSVGAGDDEDGDRQRQREQQRLTDPPEPDREGGKTDDDRDQHQPLRGLVGQELRRGLRVLGLLHELDDLGERRVGADLGRAVFEAAAPVDRRTDHRIAGLFRHRHGLAGQHGFVDLRLALEDFTVDRNLVAGPDHNHVVLEHVRGGNLDFVPVALHIGHRRRQVHQRPYGI